MDRNSPLAAAQFPRDEADIREAFRVPWSRHAITKLASLSPSCALRLGEWESAVLGDRITNIQVDRPIYIAGLARSGSTALLECITSFPQVASHRYRDFPWVFTPFWWNEFLARTPRRATSHRPRVHADGIAVSPESAEALEEPLWLAAFPSPCVEGALAHWQSPAADDRFGNNRFTKFYRRHVQKLMLIRGGNRYACKGNYHVARLEYLLTLFPDARFIIPIRRPADHVASVMKQHKLFVAGESAHPRSLLQMQACGHFEFGLDRRAITLDAPDRAASVISLWNAGEEVRAWSRYWAHIYGYLHRRLTANPALRQATIVVRFEDLCQESAHTLNNIAKHCGLTANEELLASMATWLHAPTYYQSQFTPDELSVIDEETHSVAEQFGYPAAANSSIRKAA